ncbi:protein of unknown function [Parapedobacter composti]|uniref:Uncharacterized protein n=1 Tax=Parapedobacter composti TaxID=623281 RepID=A0A1I1K1Y2_9SPHI|nr:DUF4998 domain-containing protein [Parapedobacter composti]SFC54967.1 protein of unknown function [Parapedobacter composti]
MKLRLNIRNVMLALWALPMLLGACTPMDHYYKDLIEMGDRQYVGKVSDVRVYTGNERLKIVWATPSDPSAERIVVYWNNRLDSVEQRLDHQVDTGFIAINGLAEGPYTFNMVTFDKSGNRSLSVELNAQVYGPRFQSTLRNRVVERAGELPNSAVINWYEEFSETMVHTEVRYTDMDGTVHTVTFPKDEMRLSLPNADVTLPVSHRSFFVPQPAALDTFVTEFETIQIPPPQFDVYDGVAMSASSSGRRAIDLATGAVYTLTEANSLQGQIDLLLANSSSSAMNFIAPGNSGVTGWSALTYINSDWTNRNNGTMVKYSNPTPAEIEAFNALTTVRQLYNAYNKALIDVPERPEYSLTNEGPGGRVREINAGDIIYYWLEGRGLAVAIQVLAVNPGNSGGMDLKIKTGRFMP